MLHSACKLIASVMHPEMLFTAHIDQAVITPPAVGIDDALYADFPFNDLL